MTRTVDPHASLERTPVRHGRFVLIAGVGHCGTRWLAELLDGVDARMTCHHERKCAMFPGGWYAALQHEQAGLLDAAFDPYFAFMRQQLGRHAIVGDANSWTFAMLPQVHRRQRIDRVILLVRHGVLNVHSMFTHNRGTPRGDWLYQSFFKRYWQLLGSPGGDFDALSEFECWCLYWSLSGELRRWLDEQLGPDIVKAYRFEDLLRDEGQVQRLVGDLLPNVSLDAEYVATMRQQDVNRKVAGDRTPARLWAAWSPSQRRAFERWCGPTMQRYGYDLPD